MGSIAYMSDKSMITAPDESGATTSFPRALELLSVVLPVLDEMDNLQELYSRLSTTLGELQSGSGLSDWELLFVDDGSTDGTTQWLYRKAD